MPMTVDNTFGAMFVSSVLTACMYGITTLQMYTYYGRSSSDHRLLAYLIFFLWMLDTSHAAFILAAMYKVLVTDINNLLAALEPNWLVFPAAVFMVGLSNGLVRGVLCFRVWRLSGRNWYLAAAIATAVLVAMGSCLAFAFLGIEIHSWFGLKRYYWLMIFSFSWSMAADILISLSLCTVLAMKRTAFPESNSVIKTLTLYSVNTGALSSICALACLVTYVMMQDNFIFMTFYCVYPKLILNCLLATLNGRQSLQRKMASNRVELRGLGSPGRCPQTDGSYEPSTSYIPQDSEISIQKA